jgi:hypothetical protein
MTIASPLPDHRMASWYLLSLSKTFNFDTNGLNGFSFADERDGLWKLAIFRDNEIFSNITPKNKVDIFHQNNTSCKPGKHNSHLKGMFLLRIKKQETFVNEYNKYKKTYLFTAVFR